MKVTFTPRLILSIIGAWLVGALLSVGVDHILHVTNVYPPYGEATLDHGLLLLAFVYRAVFTVAAGYLAAMWARDKAVRAIWALGIIGTIAWLGGTVAMWEYAQPWYNIGGIVTAIPLALAGGKLYELRSRGRSASPLAANDGIVK